MTAWKLLTLRPPVYSLGLNFRLDVGRRNARCHSALSRSHDGLGVRRRQPTH